MADNRFAQYGPPTTNRFAPPALPYEAPQAAANLAGKNVENVKNTATLPYDITTSRNAATSSGIDIKTKQLDYNMKAGIPPGDVRLSGPAYLDSLPPGVGDLTREMLAGRYKGAITNSRNPAVMQAALAAAHATHGNFDAAKYDERQSIIQKMTDPNSQLGALNTALAHAGVLYDQAHNVAGTNALGDNFLSNAANSVWNTIHGSSPAVRDYEGTVSKYGPEQAKAYGVGTGGERTGIEQQYSENLPLETKLSLLKNDAHLFAGKVASMAHGYDMVNGNSALDYLSPDAKAALQKIDPEGYQKFFGASVSGGNNNPPPPPPGNGPIITPPPIGGAPSGGGASTNGFNDKSDPRVASVWENAARQGLSYGQALQAVAADNKARGLNTVTPIPPDAYNKAAAYIAQNPNTEYHPFSAVLRTPLSGASAAMNDVAQSGTGAFLGNYANAMAMGLPKLAAGKDQSALFDTVAQNNNPLQSDVGQFAGTLGGLSATSKAVNATTKALDRSFPSLANIIGGSEPRAALTANTLYGMGMGAASNPDHPVAGATLGGLAGAGGEVAGRYAVGPALAKLGDLGPVQSVINAGRTLGGNSTPFVPPQAPSIGLSGATQEALPDITNRLQQAQTAGMPYMLADADPRLAKLLGSATRFSPDVYEQTAGILTPRQLGQGERAIGQINNLAPVVDVPQAQTDILKSARTQSGPLYDVAKSQPVPDLTQNPDLAAVLDRPAGQTAIRKGYETALNKGEDVGTLTYATDPQGNPVQYGNPSWNVIHYARQALDDSGDADVRQALDKQIANLNPNFKAADAKFAGIMKGSDALQAGSDATKIMVTPEATQRAMAGFPDNTPQFQQGYASNMADMIERQRLSGNPYNLVNGSMGQQAKLATVFPQGADAFNTAQGLENDMSRTHNIVLGNSATQNKAMDDRAFSLGDLADAGVDAGVAAATGNPAGLGMLLLRKGIDNARYGMNKAKADAIAPFLSNPDPGANLAALSQWSKQNAARQAYLQQAGNLGAPLGTALTLPAISWLGN